MPHRIPRHPLDTPPWGVLHRPADFGERRAVLRQALDEASVQLGEHDQLTSNGLAATNGTAPVTVASWVLRAYEAGRRAAEDELTGQARCRVCGCTENSPCEGGCFWVSDPDQMRDLCSRCAPTASIPAAGAL